MTIQWKKLFICIAVPLMVGGLSAYLTRNEMMIFNSIQQSILTPPSWVFMIVWTILYVLMGIASYLVFSSQKHFTSAFVAYMIQLIFNFFWSIIFFNLHLYLFAFIWLIILWIFILITIILFYRISKLAGYLMIPYLLWVTFAGYLNFMIYLLN